MQTPVLLIIWRRPHTLERVVEALRKVAPSHLYVACDGPNPARPGEGAKVSAARELIKQQVNWPCQIRHLYSESNQGCRLGVSRALDWFFREVEEGIILEDDCVPHPDFFPFCQTLLQRYRHDSRVWCLSGSNFQNGRWRGDGDYYFSQYIHSWGWATWRRCWRHYDADLNLLEPLLALGLHNTIFNDPVERRHWVKLWKKLRDQNKPDSWAYRWAFTCFVNGGLTALPNRNLVVNIGFDSDATHTRRKSGNSSAYHFSEGLPRLQAPSFLLRDLEADRYSFNHVFGGNSLRFPRVLYRAPARLVSSLLRSLLQGLRSHG